METAKKCIKLLTQQRGTKPSLPDAGKPLASAIGIVTSAMNLTAALRKYQHTIVKMGTFEPTHL